MPNKPTIIVVCPVSGARLCRDNKYRNHANFGTYPSCVKEFKSEAWAMRAAERFRTQIFTKHIEDLKADGATLLPDTKIIFLYAGDTMDASGVVVRRGQTTL